ncbi:MAG TPA: signal peptidase II [Ignavibacteriaceae bacterium]|nr:signal peptidase II [Ignavibacteriaceae bacterium]
MKILLLSLILFLIDQISKVLVRGFSLPWLKINHNGLYPGESKPVINDILHLTLVENPGIAFGIDPGESLRDLILIITILTCIGFLAYLVFAKNADNKVRISVALILGGAAGNLFDRVFYGYFYNYAPLFQGNVVDFLDIRLFRIFIFNNIHGNYVFNFADLSILSGVFILIYLILSMKSKEKEKNLVPQIVEDREDPA